MRQNINGTEEKGDFNYAVCNQCKGTLFNLKALIQTEEEKLFQAMEDYYLSIETSKTLY